MLDTDLSHFSWSESLVVIVIGRVGSGVGSGLSSCAYDMIIDGETAGIGWMNACQYFKQCTLTVTGNAGYTENLTRLHIKTHMIKTQ